jgi:hypothetical protein
MKKSIFFILSIILYSCSTSKIFVGQGPSGHLAVGKANDIFRSSKETLESITGKESFKPNFPLPGNILLNEEYEKYNYKNQKGLVVYKKDPNTFGWARVTFVPSMYALKDIYFNGDTTFITILKKDSLEKHRFLWREEVFGYKGTFKKV